MNQLKTERAETRLFNFSAGPAMLPTEVLLEAQAEMLNWQGTGMSMMELGHRGSEFQAVAAETESDLRELMNIPKNYHVLFLAGGATTQFAMIPLNLLGPNMQADYVVTGIWSKKAYDEALRYGEINLATQSEKENGYFFIPTQDQWKLNKNAAYLHYTPNETIDGLQFHWLPQIGEIPLVADMTSMILSQPIDVTKFGMIYAGTQKNMGQAGMNVVIIREDLVQKPLPKTPTLYSYPLHTEHHSFYNTPPTYCWYILGLVLKWLKRKGGVNKIYEINQRKAKKLYGFIDQHSEFYVCRIRPDCRSLMNVPFTTRNEKLVDLFLKEANDYGLTNLKGHRVVGGLRASIYNAMPEEGVDKLIMFMSDFEKRNM